jgi:2-oxoglutarate ferredoxin oxidoreductase subunit alpha
MMIEKTLDNHGVKIMQGNVACAEGALAGGCTFFAGYPITPASEVPEHISQRIFEVGGYFTQMEDELASVCAIMGARWGGSKSMTATSGPGFSLMMEGLGYGIVTETPMVILNVMRGGPSTGQPTSSAQQDIYQAKYGSHGDYELIVLCPSSVQETFDFTVRAFNLSEQFRVPVILLTDETLGHMREKIVIPEKVEIFEEKFEGICKEYYKPDEKNIPPRISFFEGHNVIVDGQLHDDRGIRAGHIAEISAAAVNRYNDKILDNIDEITDIEEFMVEDAEYLIISYGSVARPSIKAMKIAREKGIKVGMLKVNTIWPFPEKEIKSACAKVKKIIVPEMNVGKYNREIERVTEQDKVVGIPSLGGTLHRPEMIVEKIEEIIANNLSEVI